MRPRPLFSHMDKLIAFGLATVILMYAAPGVDVQHSAAVQATVAVASVQAAARPAP